MWCSHLGQGARVPPFTDCTVKPCTKQLHLTLAHKFYPHHQRTLEQLARAINPGHSCQWTAALYSRDMRFVHYQVGEPRQVAGLGPLAWDPVSGCLPDTALTPRALGWRYLSRRKNLNPFLKIILVPAFWN